MTNAPDPSTLPVGFKPIGTNGSVAITFKDGHTANFDLTHAISLGYKPVVGGAPAANPANSSTPLTPAQAALPLAKNDTKPTNSSSSNAFDNSGTPGTPGTGAGANTNVNAGTSTSIPIGSYIGFDNKVITTQQISDEFNKNPALQKQLAAVLEQKAGLPKSSANDPIKLFTAYISQLQAATNAGQNFNDYLDSHSYNQSVLKASLDPNYVSGQLNDFLLKNNLKYTPEQVSNLADQVTSGKQSLDGLKQNLRTTVVASQYPAWKTQIDAGTDIATILQPYKSQLAHTLEIPETNIANNDPRILKGIQAVDKNGQPSYMPLWQYNEQVAKKDPSYGYTSNAWQEQKQTWDPLLKIMGIGDTGLIG